MGQPAARAGDLHVCPMLTGTVPHVGGPVLPPGCATVFVGGQPAARVTDLCTCTGPPDVIAKGSTMVLIGGLLAARMGDSTAHGGTIVAGIPSVLVGEAGQGAGVGAGGPPGSQFIGIIGGKNVYKMPDGTIKVGAGIVIRGDATFQSKTLSALTAMGRVSNGKKIVNSIDSSGKTVTIVHTANGNSENATNFNDGLAKSNGSKGSGSDSIVKFNPDKTQIGDGSEPWMTRPPSVGLGHELIHAAHDANGTTAYDYSNPNKSPQEYEYQAVGLQGSKNGTSTDYSGNEFTENKLRSDLGEPERTSY